MILKTEKFNSEIEKISDNKNVLLGNNPFTNTLVYLENNRVEAFLKYDVIYEKVEIIYIFVCKHCRNTGIAKALLETLINEVKDKENITLEVRKDNIAAINLYKKYNFKHISTRKKYYNGIDALLMEKKLK